MNDRPGHIARRARPLLAVCLWSLAWPGFALGLGQIQVKSRAGQPLLAEIPIVSSDPAELQGLQARLASPDTFRRIGLQPPDGAVSGLQFAPAMDERGRPVIRVTTAEPVQQPALTFLVEVEWGQGRLVREYSALVDAPRTVAAPVQPPVQAPVAAPSNSIVRPPTAASAPVAAPPTPAQVPQKPPSPPPAPVPVPAPESVAETAIPPPPPTAPPRREQVPAPPADAAAYGPVKPGETLTGIAASLPAANGYSLDQTMLALLRTNPDAFIGQDINRLRQGAVLKPPASDELSRYSAGQASAMVREQVARWREARRAVVQPAAPAADAESADATANAAAARPANAPATTAPQRRAEARLQIAPPSAADTRQAGTRSGASAGGEGDMLRQELQETQEALTARDAEVAELKTRLAEVEKLQQQQQQLIALKDSALASAQQRLAQANATVPAATAETATPGTRPGQAQGGFAWWWLVPALLLAAAIAWLVSRRRRTAASTPAPGVDRAGLAAAMPPRQAAAPVDAPSVDAPPSAPVVETLPAPAWAAGAAKPAAPVASPASGRPRPISARPAWHADDAATAPASDRIATLNPAPAGRERIELARAYLDLGDRTTARSLLHEVMDGGDAEARAEAARLLDGIA